MGRELKRVPLDFEWPLDQRWAGYLNSLQSEAQECPCCKGSGYSPTAERLKNMWYGYAPFRPEDRGSVPLQPRDPAVWARAQHNVGHLILDGQNDAAIEREAERLCQIWNGAWSHHLNADDVAALLAVDRLVMLTHTWTPDNGWQPKDPPHVPTPAEVNAWSLSSFGHDSMNCWVCVGAECDRLGVSQYCERCQGDRVLWPSPEAKAAYETWERTEPPEGEGYQLWETVTEGSPISPVFDSPEALAQWLVAHPEATNDENTSLEQWLTFIEETKSAPTLIVDGAGVHPGSRLKP